MLTFPEPLVEASLVGRVNRFTAMVEIDGERLPAHLPTSSRMAELLLPGARVILQDRARPGRVTRYDIILVLHGQTWVSIDSLAPNRLIGRLLRERGLPEFAGWGLDRAECFFGQSRFDFRLCGRGGICWVEVKSVTLVEEGTALFPDAPTMRGARHLHELALAKENGDSSAAIFVVQRADAREFAPNRRTDPAFADALADAISRGVSVYAYRCAVSPEGMAIVERVPVRIGV